MVAQGRGAVARVCFFWPYGMESTSAGIFGVRERDANNHCGAASPMVVRRPLSRTGMIPGQPRPAVPWWSCSWREPGAADRAADRGDGGHRCRRTPRFDAVFARLDAQRRRISRRFATGIRAWLEDPSVELPRPRDPQRGRLGAGAVRCAGRGVWARGWAARGRCGRAPRAGAWSTYRRALPLVDRREVGDVYLCPLPWALPAAVATSSGAVER
jgi:hypothetical protein